MLEGAKEGLGKAGSTLELCQHIRCRSRQPDKTRPLQLHLACSSPALRVSAAAPHHLDGGHGQVEQKPSERPRGSRSKLEKKVVSSNHGTESRKSSGKLHLLARQIARACDTSIIEEPPASGRGIDREMPMSARLLARTARPKRPSQASHWQAEASGQDRDRRSHHTSASQR